MEINIMQDSAFIPYKVPELTREAIIKRHSELTLETFLKFQGITNYELVNIGRKSMLNINQDVKLIGIGFEIPIIINKIDGKLDISFNKLVNTENFPKFITKGLNIKSNLIKVLSLEETHIGGNLLMDNNKFLRSLKGIGVVYGSISAYQCNLDSVDFGREMLINGDLVVSKNGIRSLKIPNKLIIMGGIILCENLILNHDPKDNENLSYDHIDLSENPISSDSWESNCKGW
jgi:hypothetical protein